MADADLHLYFDPVCPFCWLTAKWVRTVAARRRYVVDWRFISLRLVNAHVDYAAHFPPEYEAGHTAGLRLLRVAARTRAEHGGEAVGRLYEALGDRIFEVEPGAAPDLRAPGALVRPALVAADLPVDLAGALDDSAWDAVVQAETDQALALTGRDVGTPILHFAPPDGAAFFGPVISRLPPDDRAEELWEHVVGLARFPGFAELKRSLREQPQLRALGLGDDGVGAVEEWAAGRRVTR